MPGAITNAFSDIRAAVRLRRVWIALASEDIGDQHRRTTLGPLWLVVNYLAFAAIFIFLFDRGRGDPTYPAYVAMGLLVWLFISETLTQASTLFVREESMIKGTTLPLSIYIMRLTMQSVIRTAYSLIGCALILYMSGKTLEPGALWALPGILFVFLATPPAIVLFAFAGAFFPDSQFIVSNLMRLGMFFTPIFWHHEGQGGLRGAFYQWNPFTYFIEVVRLPVMSGELPIHAWTVAGGVFVALWVLAIFVFGRYRKQVVFVL